MTQGRWFCPVCHREGVDPKARFCPEDGARLVPIEERGAPWIGQVLDGKYRVVRFIDAGGMAEVYEAERVGSGKRVALKLLHEALAANDDAVRRFLEEARLIALIAHPNVVAIEDFGTLPGMVQYMVMELLEGETLWAVLARDGMRPLNALNIAIQACEGLAAAHARNVIHCDIKPGNIFLQRSPDGRDPVVKILDLGIGRLFASGAGGLGATSSMAGTPAYMSPEQARGRPLGPASDIYSMGVVLYEMLLGRPPFEGSSPIAVLTKHVEFAPTWPAGPAAVRGVPAEAAQVVLRALSKTPKGRQESMLDLQRDLAAVATRLRHSTRADTVEIPTVTRRVSHRPGDGDTEDPKLTGRSRPQVRGSEPVPLESATGADAEVVVLAPDVYWVGRRHGAMLECNVYLRVFRRGSTEVNVLIDPGPPKDLDVVTEKVSAVLGSMRRIDYVFLNHQDPDVASNAAAIQHASPRAKVLCSEDTWRLVRFYGLDPKRFVAVEDFPGGSTTLATGHTLVFAPTPFCHFRGAVMLYDPESRVLFSGDLYGGAHAAGMVADESSWPGVVQFHQIYMPARLALQKAAAAVHRLSPAPAIVAPQHGAIVVGEAAESIAYEVADLDVGLDLLDSTEDAEVFIAAANDLLREYADTEGAERAEGLLEDDSADSSFTSLFVIGASGLIVGFKVEPRAALDALATRALSTLPVARRSDLQRSIRLIWRQRGLRGAPSSYPPRSPRRRDTTEGNS